MIPEDLLEKENKLVSLLKRAREQGVDPEELRHEEDEAGFKKEVYWVKHAGENKLDIPMFLRPTSETAMYTMFPLWIRSHADLPLKIYQTGIHFAMKQNKLALSSESEKFTFLKPILPMLMKTAQLSK